MSQKDFTGKEKGVSRRSVLKAVGAAGLAAVGTLGSSSVVRAASPSTVDIPKYKQRGKVIEYKSVPKDWNEHRKQAQKVNRRVQNTFSERSDVFGIGLGRDSKKFGGKCGLQIRIQREGSESPSIQTDEVPSEIPDHIDGIPVEEIPAPESYGPGFCTN